MLHKGEWLEIVTKSAFQDKREGFVMKEQLIAVWEIDEIMKNENAMLVDLRKAALYNQGHMMGAVNISYDIFFEKTKYLDRSVVLILYCDRGNTSLRVGKIMGEKGFKVYTVVGGYLAYEYVGRRMCEH